MYFRAKQTKETILEAFLSLMTEKPVREITVSEICERAGLNRTTFYKHYRSTEDILGEMERKWLEDLTALFEERSAFDENTILTVFRLLEKEKQSRRYEEDALPPGFLAGLVKIIKVYALDEWRRKLPKASAAEAEIALDSLILGTLHAITYESGKYDRGVILKNTFVMRDGYIRMYS